MSLEYRQLDPLIHQPARLSIMAALDAVKEVEFGIVRDTIGISDSLLSRYVTVLEQAGYIRVRKGFVAKRPRTWLAITAKGKKAFRSHLKILQKIVKQELR